MHRRLDLLNHFSDFAKMSKSLTDLFNRSKFCRELLKQKTYLKESETTRNYLKPSKTTLNYFQLAQNFQKLALSSPTPLEHPATSTTQPDTIPYPFSLRMTLTRILDGKIGK